MSDTYAQFYVQTVFAVKYREALIHESIRVRVHQYLTGIVQGNGHKMISIYAMPDHVHMFFGYRPAQSLPDLMRMVKADSSKWINEQKFTKQLFRWQEGYAAFSYSRSQIPRVAAYVENQPIHHKKISFAEEYRGLLEKFDIAYNPKHLFHPPM